MKKLRRELRTRALLASLPLLKILPPSFGAALGWLAWFLVGRQRRLAQKHLAMAFPDKAQRERDRIGRASFASLGRSALESARSKTPSIELLPEDERLLRKAYAEGRGVILVSAHIGAWELFARRMASLGLPSAVVAKEAHDPRLTALLQRERERSGVRVFWRGSPFPAREILRFLKSGGMVGVLIDQDTKVAGHFVPFFGRPAFTPRAASDLAVHLGAPIIFGCIHRVASQVHRVVIRPIDVPRTGDRDRDSLAITAAATAIIEQEVRQHPDEWVWMHPRWSTQPPEIARET